MSATMTKLLSEFEALGVEEKQEFVRELIHHLPPWDSGLLRDDVAAAAGDRLAAMIEEEEERAS
jgi:predicted metallopeptidase